MEFKALARRLRISAVTCLAVFTLTASEHHGVVKFGAVPVPGATVTATKDDKKAVAITDESGAYLFPDLEDGVWKVTVEMQTFATQSKEIGVAGGAPGAEWDLKMQSIDEIKPAQQAPTPAPAATPPASGTTTPAAGTTPQQPASTPTASAAPAANTKGKKGAATPATPQQGFQRTEVNAAADAGAAPAAPSAVPSIAEAQTASDAFVVNGSTSNGIERRAIGNGRKGPRSLFNGGIDFRSFESDYLDARSYSTLGTNTPRSPYTQYIAGGTLAGPLWIPHLFRWQGNFNISYQTNRNRNATNTPYTMPTAQERAGNFSGVTASNGSPVVITDPTTGQPIPNGIIPASEISPQAKYLLGFYPLPQFAASLLNNYEEPVITRSVSDQFLARVNKTVNNKSSLNGLFGMQANSNDPENILSWQDDTQIHGYHAQLAYNRNFTRTFIGRFFLDYTRYSVHTIPYFATTGTNVSGLAGITGNDQTPSNYGPPGLGFSQSQIYSLSDTSANFLRNQTSWASGVLTYIRRPHQFQFGGDFKIQDVSTVGQSNGRGSFGFNGLATGYDFADFLFGIPDTASIAVGNPDKYLHSNIYDLFINDNWNVNSSFTFQWGVRWNYQSPFTEEYGRLANLDITPGFGAAAPVTAQNPTGSLTGDRYPSSLIHPDKHQFSPITSFAWRPIFGSSMVVRGGYSVLFNTSLYQGIAYAMAQQGPFSKSLNVTNATTPLTLKTGFQIPAGVVADTFAVDPNLKVGYAQNMYLSVQQNLTAALLVTVQYSYIKGTRNLQEFQPDTFAPGSAAAGACTSCYTYLTSNGNSTRNSGQVSLRRRFHGGVSTNFTYTLAKSIDDDAALLNYGGGGGGGLPVTVVAQNWQNLSGERGPSVNDQRHNFTGTFQYSTGVGVHGGALLSGWRGQLFKGWTLSSTVTVGSGSPFTPIYYQPLVGSGLQVVRPEYLGGNPYGGPGGLFLNPAAFGAPPPGQYGDVGRDSLYGPYQFGMSGSAARSFNDKYTLTVNASNVLNHPVATGVYSSFDPLLVGKFGELTPPGAMRKISATFRWTF
jgi:hypothetical protein